jgi:hypothetical protein
MGHARPHDPNILVQDDRPCESYSKPKDNRFGLQERVCKCGRARIVKVNAPGSNNQFAPLLDGDVLPLYWKLEEAKAAIDAADQGDPLPKATRPTYTTTSYQNVGTEQGAASWEAAKQWFHAKAHGGAGAPPTTSEDLLVLGLDEGATKDEIRKRVRVLQIQWHPDKHPNDENAAKQFRLITDAWERLQAV